jgi:predicted enzyme related to lactoylglutathione lyase
MATKKKSKQAKSAKKTKPAKKPAKKIVKKTAKHDVPALFRLNIEVGDVDRAADFYGALFGADARKQAGSRVYVDAGPVTLQIVDVTQHGAGKPHTAAKALYFIVDDLDAVYDRARKLACLSQEEVHGVPGGNITVRPWGERSFYAEDPWANPLCFVEAGTVYPG